MEYLEYIFSILTVLMLPAKEAVTGPEMSMLMFSNGRGALRVDGAIGARLILAVKQGTQLRRLSCMRLKDGINSVREANCM